MTPVPAMPRLLPAALCAALAACATAPPPPSAVLHVMTYNIHAGRDTRGEPNLERVAEVVRRATADLVLLQEVDRGTRRSAGEDQLARLQELTGFHGAFAKSLDYQGGEYGIALLSRWPIREHRTVALPVEPPQERAGGAHEPRVALLAVIAAPAGEIRVLNTHLDPSSSPVYRAQEMVHLLAVAAEVRSRGPLVLGGDLNALPESSVVRAPGVAFADAFATCGRGPGESYPADSPARRIDYIFYGGALSCADAVVPETTASDHRPLLVTFHASTASRR